MDIYIFILFGIPIIFFCFLAYIVIKNDGPLNVVLLLIGLVILAFTALLATQNLITLKAMNEISTLSGITGGTFIVLGFTDFLKKENDLKNAGDWRKNLYKLEQKPYYTINDLYELNSYINPYSKKNKVSIIVNEVIISILKSHKGKSYVSYKNSNYNNCFDTKNCKDENYISYNTLKKKMINFLQNDNLSELELEKNNDITAFDFSVDKIITKKENEESTKKLEENKDNGYLTPEENNLVRLACHILLKAEWKEWAK